jgi:hypothetical protein
LLLLGKRYHVQTNMRGNLLGLVGKRSGLLEERHMLPHMGSMVIKWRRRDLEAMRQHIVLLMRIKRELRPEGLENLLSKLRPVGSLYERSNHGAKVELITGIELRGDTPKHVHACDLLLYLGRRARGLDAKPTELEAFVRL